MPRSTLSASAETSAETSPAVAASPAAKRLTAFAVLASRAAGTAPDAAWLQPRRRQAGGHTPRPRLMSRLASRARPVASRLATVPSGSAVAGRPRWAFSPPGRRGRWQSGTSPAAGEVPRRGRREVEPERIRLRLRRRLRQDHHLLLPRAALRGPLPGLAGRLVRHAVKPVGQQLGGADGSGLAEQHQEGSLEGVLRLVVIGQRSATDAPDHRRSAAAPAPPGPAGRGFGEGLQQLAVGLLGAFVQPRGAAQVVQQNLNSTALRWAI